MNLPSVISIPPDFKYRDVFLQGRPQHGRLDDFSLRHPKMDLGKRAKIFAPFDALRGFSFAIWEKTVQYVDCPELSREELRELNRRLAILWDLTRSTRQIRQEPVMLTVTFFAPCEDPQHEAFNRQGQIRTLTGVCRGVDPELTETLRLDERLIPFENLLRLEFAEASKDIT